MLVPSQLYAGVPEKVCVLLNHLNETVALTVTLEYETQGRNLLTDLEAKNSFYCSSFTVSIPPWGKGNHYRESTLVDALGSDPQQLKNLSLVLCDDLDGWDRGGKEVQEGGDICIYIVGLLC